jgi:hypothetical protein
MTMNRKPSRLTAPASSACRLTRCEARGLVGARGQARGQVRPLCSARGWPQLRIEEHLPRRFAMDLGGQRIRPEVVVMCAVTEGRVRSRAARTASLPRHLQERARAHRRHPQRHRFRTTPAPDLPGPPHHEQLPPWPVSPGKPPRRCSASSPSSAGSPSVGARSQFCGQRPSTSSPASRKCRRNWRWQGWCGVTQL